MAEKDAGAARLDPVETVERGQHRLAVVGEARQPALAQRPAEIAGIGGKHDFAAVEPQFQRLVPWRVARGRQADDAAVAEQVVLAGNFADRVAEIEIAPVEAVDGGEVRVRPRLPLAFLRDDDGVRDLGVAAEWSK